MYYGEVGTIRKLILKMKVRFIEKMHVEEEKCLVSGKIQKIPVGLLSHARNLDPTKTCLSSFSKS